MKDYYYKRKIFFFNHLINRVEELENVCLSKSIFEYYPSFLKFKSIIKSRKVWFLLKVDRVLINFF